jgi:hypothetical protein
MVMMDFLEVLGACWREEMFIGPAPASQLVFPDFDPAVAAGFGIFQRGHIIWDSLGAPGVVAVQIFPLVPACSCKTIPTT